MELDSKPRKVQNKTSAGVCSVNYFICTQA